MSMRERAAKVQINAMLPDAKYGYGSYKMTSVKKMVATEDFIAMSSHTRNCEIDTYDTCRTKNLIAKCGCVPWELRNLQVRGRAHIK